MINIEATHYSARLVCKGVVLRIPAAVGKKENKILKHRVRDKMFNESLARVWLSESLAGRTRFHAALRALEKSR
jgi:hypothetical protein